MSERWGDVDALMRKLGSLRAAADAARTTPQDRAAIEQAITRTPEAIDAMIDEPQDTKALAAARSALMTAEGLIGRAIKGRAG